MESVGLVQVRMDLTTNKTLIHRIEPIEGVPLRLEACDLFPLIFDLRQSCEVLRR